MNVNKSNILKSLVGTLVYSGKSATKQNSSCHEEKRN